MPILKSSFESNFGNYSAELPAPIREKAERIFKQFREARNRTELPRGMDNKPVENHPNQRSIRIDGSYRALGRKIDDRVEWYWIGDHNGYMRRLKDLKG